MKRAIVELLRIRHPRFLVYQPRKQVPFPHFPTIVPPNSNCFQFQFQSISEFPAFSKDLKREILTWKGSRIVACFERKLDESLGEESASEKIGCRLDNLGTWIRVIKSWGKEEELYVTLHISYFFETDKINTFFATLARSSQG